MAVFGGSVNESGKSGTKGIFKVLVKLEVNPGDVILMGFCENRMGG